MLLLVSPSHPTVYLCSTLNLNSTAMVQFKNGSYPFTLAAGLRVTSVNITTYDDMVITIIFVVGEGGVYLWYFTLILASVNRDLMHVFSLIF